MWFSLFLTIFLLMVYVDARGHSCKSPKGRDGKCIQLTKCNPLMKLIRKADRTDEDTDILIQSRCGPKSRMPFVCCPSALPSREECGIQDKMRIIGGEKAALDEFPWMAVLEYRFALDNRKNILCAGTLINERYVLTAAHCVTRNHTYTLETVRLGEYNVSSPGNDCLTIRGLTFCNELEVNAGIEETIIHPKYSAEDLENDIALVRLDQDVPFSDYIRPICLPEIHESPHVGKRLLIVGWGETLTANFNDVILKIDVSILDNSECSSIMGYMKKHTLCVGGESKKDACYGDSGGPLMTTTSDYRWSVAGIVSHGLGGCGQRDKPGIYTDVAKYVNWIRRTVY